MSEELKIERGLPIPKAKRSKYPLDRLEVGDSFLVPVPPGESADKIKARVATAIQDFKDHDPYRRFTLRRVEDGIRVWTVE